MIDPDDYLQSLAEAFWNEHSDKERVKYVRLKRAPAPKDVSSATWLHFGELGLWRVKRNRLWRLGRQHGSVIRAALAAGELIERTLTIDEALKHWLMTWRKPVPSEATGLG